MWSAVPWKALAVITPVRSFTTCAMVTRVGNAVTWYIFKRKEKTFYTFSKTVTFTIRALLKPLYFPLTISHYHSQLLMILSTPRMFRWGYANTGKVFYCLYKIFLEHNSTNEGKRLFDVVYLILDQNRFSWYPQPTKTSVISQPSLLTPIDQWECALSLLFYVSFTRQGWPCGEITCLSPMWPWFNFRTQRHMWLNLLVLYSALKFLRGYSGFPSHQKPTFDLIWFVEQ